MNYNLTSASSLILLSGCESNARAFADFGIVLATIALVFATWKLAQNTLSLSKLTKRLVDIETKRDERDAREKQLKDLATGLAAAITVQKIYPRNFAQRLSKPADLPNDEMHSIEVLQSFKQHIADTDTHSNLDHLCGVFDSVRRQKTGVRQNEPDIAQRVKTLQDRIQRFVDQARHEISSPWGE